VLSRNKVSVPEGVLDKIFYFSDSLIGEAIRS
jgi:hypothetical protein